EYANVLLADELVALPPREALKARMKGVVLVDGTELFVGTLADYAKKHPELRFMGLGVQNGGHISEVRGQIAQKGKVTGRVRLVKNRKQADEVVPGEIMVSPMTTPDFIAGMQKAAAFITDEGGIVCHAAIVAREMQKPCVIGTKIATQVLKNGDMVEVDADKGIVRVLRRA
ncbi:MAG: PEP-utilizing enzyme, partial [bacterium]|nr:PEP-utilizing enzyme [bacterium]